MCQVPVTDQSEYELFVELLRRRLTDLESRASASVRPCLRTCFVKCVVASFLSYREREDQSFGDFLQTRYFAGPPQIFSSGEGECSEIALLTTDLGRRLGIESMRNVSTFQHEFNQVEIEGRTLTFDAGSPSCLLFEDP